jgi:hypothetical protein
LTFADIVEGNQFDDLGKIVCDRLHPNVVNWRCRPVAALRYMP